MFADDIKLYAQVANDDDAVALQDDLDSLYSWSKQWKLSLNPGKCKTFTMTLKRRLIIFFVMPSNTLLWNESMLSEIWASAGPQVIS